MIRFQPLLAAFALALFVQTASAQTQSAPTPPAPPRIPTLSLSGEGTIEAAPELATLQIGVSVKAKTASEALAENSKLLAAALDAAKQHGLEARDLQTSALSLRPDIIRTERWPFRDVTGYQASNLVTIRVRDISRLGALLDRLVVLGVNDIRNISFSVAKPAALIEQARMAAMRDVMEKARKYAEAGDFKIVRILTINEGTVEAPTPRLARQYDASLASAARPEVPIEAGELTFRARVTATIEIGPK